jgi:hypothetical protein
MKLVSLADLKLDLGVADATHDALLDRLNEIASAEVLDIVGYPVERAVRVHADYVATPARAISIPFAPLHDVTKLVVDGVTWLDTGEGVEAEKGFGFTPWGVIRAPYGKRFFREIEITIESGYYLADDEGPPAVTRDLPLAFERAVAEIIRPRFHAVERDPSVRAEAVPGVYSVTFADGGGGSLKAPPSAYDALAPYRLVRVA